mmetsp:Transcript_37635/g.93560  ORF Transcript_37635/g.93560 Transcript_37635/m.93560 type:complete len:230 (-) Transcript_37635:1799-2488(-)
MCERAHCCRSVLLSQRFLDFYSAREDKAINNTEQGERSTDDCTKAHNEIRPWLVMLLDVRLDRRDVVRDDKRGKCISRARVARGGELERLEHPLRHRGGDMDRRGHYVDVVLLRLVRLGRDEVLPVQSGEGCPDRLGEQAALHQAQLEPERQVVDVVRRVDRREVERVAAGVRRDVQCAGRAAHVDVPKDLAALVGLLLRPRLCCLASARLGGPRLVGGGVEQPQHHIR